MGSLLVDSTTVSKAALASAASLFSRRPTRKSSQPTSPPSQTDPDRPTEAYKDFDLQFMGPAKFAEIQALEENWPGHAPANSNTAIGRDNLTSTMCGMASPAAGDLSSPVLASDCKLPVDADAMTPEFWNRTVRTADGSVVSTHEAARSIMESVFIQKGLTSPGSSVFTKSLPQLLGMVPGSAEAAQAEQNASDASRVRCDLLAGHSTASPLAEQEATLLAHSNAEPSTAGTAGPAAELEPAMLADSGPGASTVGAEPGEQWAGSLPASQVAAVAMVAAAENEAAAQVPSVSSLLKLEEALNEPDAEAQCTSVGAGMYMCL